MSATPVFDEAFRARLHDLFRWRRDVRRFRRDPLPDAALERLVEVASLAPSVGLSQPWRFVVVDDLRRRLAIKECFATCNADALAAQSTDRAFIYSRLKLAGLDEAPCHFAVYADHGTRQGHGLGRRTMPDTVDHSAVMAVHTLWLAARAEGLGLGWVSILDPAEVSSILAVAPEWTLIGYFCLGYPSEDHLRPELEREGWERRSPSVLVRR